MTSFLASVSAPFRHGPQGFVPLVPPWVSLDGRKLDQHLFPRCRHRAVLTLLEGACRRVLMQGVVLAGIVCCDCSKEEGISMKHKNLCQELVDSVLCPGQVAKTKASYRMLFRFKRKSRQQSEGK